MRAVGKRLVAKLSVSVIKQKGIYIPEGAQGTLQNLGQIISKGEACTLDVKPGDWILVRGARTIPGLPYDVIEEPDVICVVTPEDIEHIRAGTYTDKKIEELTTTVLKPEDLPNN